MTTFNHLNKNNIKSNPNGTLKNTLKDSTATFNYIDAGKRTINKEINAVNALQDRLGENFSQACNTIMRCRGKVIVMGIGKSGHIAKKIAATLASTGTPSFFVHPAEAGHGDLGMISKDDAMIIISNSGSSPEILALLPVVKNLGIPCIAMTGGPTSMLAQSADICLDISVETEACPLDLAPTSSTTVTLVLGDALAVALLEARGFTQEDFALSHPSGNLGKKLLLRIQDVMNKHQDIPQTQKSTSLKDALVEISAKGLGMTCVINTNQHLIGVFTDGDLRRCISAGININTAKIGDVMTAHPAKITASALAIEALKLMESKKITALIVEDEQSHIVGILHMHDLVQAGLS